MINNKTITPFDDKSNSEYLTNKLNSKKEVLTVNDSEKKSMIIRKQKK